MNSHTPMYSQRIRRHTADTTAMNSDTPMYSQRMRRHSADTTAMNSDTPTHCRHNGDEQKNFFHHKNFLSKIFFPFLKFSSSKISCFQLLIFKIFSIK
jgi:hypothetical protein